MVIWYQTFTVLREFISTNHMDYNINWISYEGWEIFVTKEL